MSGGLQGEGRLVDHDVPLGRGGPQGLSGWGTCDPSTLTATVRQQAQLDTQRGEDNDGSEEERCFTKLYVSVLSET